MRSQAPSSSSHSAGTDTAGKLALPGPRAGRRAGTGRAGGPSPAGRSSGGDFAQLLRVAERAQLLQALVLDLPDPLARDVERPPHLVKRAGMLAVQPVAELEDAALALRELAEDPAERLAAKRDLRGLVRERLGLV